jgi:sphinganine-1-phosphate aldolase
MVSVSNAFAAKVKSMSQIPLPEKGMLKDELFTRLKGLHSEDTDWHKGRMFSLIYNAGPDVEQVAKEAYYEFMIENALSPFSFPSLLRMENEIIPMVSSMFHSDEAVGYNETCCLAPRLRWILG